MDPFQKIPAIMVRAPSGQAVTQSEITPDLSDEEYSNTVPMEAYSPVLKRGSSSTVRNTSSTRDSRLSAVTGYQEEYDVSATESSPAQHEISLNSPRRTHFHLPHLRGSSASHAPQTSQIPQILPLSPQQGESTPVENVSFIDEAAAEDDIEALRAGISYALGSDSTSKNWFPSDRAADTDKHDSTKPKASSSQDKDSKKRQSAVHSIQSSNLYTFPSADYTENIPLRDMSSANNRAQDMDHDHTVHSVLSRPPDLEAGLSPIRSEPAPKGFSNMLARFSDRIAGTGDDPLPTPISGNFSFFRDDKTPAEAGLVDPALGASSLGNVSATNLNDVNLRKLDSKNEAVMHSTAMNSFHSLNRTISPMKSPAVPETDNLLESSPNNIPALFGNSLMLFSPDSKLRNWCHRTLSLPRTNTFLLSLLFLQIGLLSYRQWNPHAQKGYFYHGYNWADYILIAINVSYTFEIFAKIVAYGLFDDASMYEELGLEYPVDEISGIFARNYVKEFIGIIFRKPYQTLGGLRANNHNLEADTKRDSKRDSKIDSPNDNGPQFRPETKRESKRFSKLMTTKRKHKSQLDNIKLAPVDTAYSSDLDVREMGLEDIDMEFPGQHRSESTSEVNIRLKYEGTKLNFTPHDPLRTYGNGDSGNEQAYSDYENDQETLRSKSYKHNHRKSLHHANTLLLAAPVPHIELNRAYLHNSWHKIDFISMLFFWISLFLSINHYDAKHDIMIFRALSCLRILRFCKLTTGTTTILTSCRLAIPQLIDLSIFIGCFWLFFGIIGVQSFKSSLTRHCVWTNPDDPTDTYINSSSFCGSSIGTDGKPQAYLNRDGSSSNTIKGFRCPVNSQCVSGDNPYGGTVNFDNILQSMEMVFVVVSANTFTDIMYDTMDSDNLAACLFYIFGIFTLTVWLVNISIAVIIASFHLTVKEAVVEKKKPRRYNIFTRLFESFDREDSMNLDRINELKKQNVFLKYYYRFDFIWVIIILVGLFVQCFRRYDMDDTRRHLLYRFEAAFTLALFIEIVLRFFFHLPHWRLFFDSKRNVFDLILAVITGVIIINPIKDALGHSYYWLTAFQIMRFYRVVLATPFTRKLWLKIMKDIKAILDLVLFYFILTYLWSVIMARYFEGTVPLEDVENINFPMNTLPNAFVALYVITSTENWTDILYNLQENASTTSSRSFGAVFLISWFIVSNMVIFNFFTAVIARSLEVSEEGKRKKQLLQFIENMTDRFHTIESGNGVLSKLKSKIFKSNSMKDELEKAVVNLLLSGTAVNEFLEDEDSSDDEDDAPHNLQNSTWKRWLQVNYWRTNNFFKNPFNQKPNKKLNVNNFDPALFAKSIISERNVLISQQNKFLEENPNYNNVFYVISPKHRIRRLCQRIVRPSSGERIDGVDPFKPVSEAFIVVMFIATVALVITACYLTPLYRRDMYSRYGYYNWTFYLEVSFVILFSIEFSIKVLADGFSFTPNAYMRSSWNIIDLLVLISLWIELIAFLKNDGRLSRIVRGLKALRALRLLTISETAKNNFHNTMISGFWKILGAAMISLCLLFPFAIWGLNIFNGRLGACIDGSSFQSTCFNEYQNEVFNWNIMSPNVYQQPQLEFNRFATSFVTLFEIVSLEGWVNLLMDVVNSTGVGTPPSRFASPINGFFVILFNLIGIIFILTLFVSVIINNYSKTTGRAYMTREQVAWYQVKKILLQVKPSKRKDFNQLSWISRIGYRMTVEKNPIWTRTMNTVLFFHILALLLECFPSGEKLYAFRFSIFMFSAFMFLVHSLLVFFGQGFSTFVRYKWNWFNLFISSGAFTTTVVGYFIDQNSAFININKLFLVGILVFIIPRSNRLSQLLRFASAGLPVLLSLMFTWVVVFLVFAIAMNQIFGMTKVGPNGTGNLNLRSVPKSLILLFRCSFGEGWNNIMVDYTLAAPFCTSGTTLDDTDTDCGSKQYAYVLFIAWNIISMYIFLNMFVSLILDSFSYIKHKSAYSLLMEREETRRFKRTWQRFDPEGTGYIKPIELPALLHSLQGALSFHFYQGELEIPALCKKWFTRNDPNDPYDIDVNYDEIEETWAEMNVPKIRERRQAYEMFIEEALLTMELNSDPGISFSRILLQLPLYNSFEPGSCLNLINFLERRLLIQKVLRRMHTRRVYETIAAYACRWKYKKDQRMGIRDTNINFDTQLKRNSYLTNESFGGGAPSIMITDANEVELEREGQQNEHDSEDAYSGADEKNKDETFLYEPSSPLNVYKGRNRSPSGNHLDTLKKMPLFIDTNSNNSSPPSSPSDGRGSHVLDQYSNVSLIDISTLGDLGASLENSSWGDVLRKVHSDRSETSEKSAKSGKSPTSKEKK